MKRAPIIAIATALLACWEATAQPITVTKPAAPDSWVKGTQYTITWTASSQVGGTVAVLLRDAGDTTTDLTIASNAANTGSLPWTVPLTVAAGKHTIRVVASGVYGTSAQFGIAEPAPGGGTPLKPGHAEVAKVATGAVAAKAAAPVLETEELVFKPDYKNWGNCVPQVADYAQPPYGVCIGWSVLPPGTDTTHHAVVGYDHLSFVWPETGGTGWTTRASRSKVYFHIDQLQSKSAKLVSAKMHLKQVASKRANDNHASCATGYFIFTALWTDFYNPPITTPTPTAGLNFGSTDYTIDVTASVKKWLDGTQTNYGFLLKSEEVTWGQQAKSCGSALDVELILKFRKN